VTYQAAVTALLELAAMLAVVVAYVSMARRHHALWHPLSIILTVVVVGVAVSVLGEVLFNSGWAGVPATLRRSLVGAFGWGVVMAIGVWIGRRLFVRRAKSER
jgi:hypothetical protein